MRLIDADELLKGKEDHQMISTHLIWNAPTVDAVPVVRCKYCKHWIDHRCRKVRSLDDWRKCDDYCSFAERKEE